MASLREWEWVYSVLDSHVHEFVPCLQLLNDDLGYPWQYERRANAQMRDLCLPNSGQRQVADIHFRPGFFRLLAELPVDDPRHGARVHFLLPEPGSEDVDHFEASFLDFDLESGRRSQHFPQELPHALNQRADDFTALLAAVDSDQRIDPLGIVTVRRSDELDAIPVGVVVRH